MGHPLRPTLVHPQHSPLPASFPTPSPPSFVPVLVLAARMCPEGVEATLFTTLISMRNRPTPFLLPFLTP